MTAQIEPRTPWLRDVHRFDSSETQIPSFVPPADVLRLPQPESLKPRRIQVQTGSPDRENERPASA